jgi:aquaporin Z
LYLIANGKAGFSFAGGFASNGFAEHSPGKYDPSSCFIAEVVMTFFFLIVILGATHGRAPKGFAPLAIGLGLTLIHLISIPVTNTSVNPARSTGPAIFVAIYSDPWPVKQLWMFWIAPILGALLAGFFYSWLGDDEVPLAEPVVGEDPNTAVVEVVET